MNEKSLPKNLVCPIDTTSVHPWVISEPDVSPTDIDQYDYSNLPIEEVETLLFKCNSDAQSHRFTLESENGQPLWKDALTGQTYPVQFRQGQSIKRLRWQTNL